MTKSNKCIVLLSSTSNGGARTYQIQQLNYLSLLPFDCYLIDQNPQKILEAMDISVQSNVTPIQVDVWKNIAQVKFIVSSLRNKYSELLIVISNPTVILKYFSLLFNLKMGGANIVHLTLHSRMNFKLFITAPLFELLTSIAILLCVSKISYVSQYTRRYWCGRYPWLAKISHTVVHNGVDMPITRTSLTKTGPLFRVGFVGRLDKDKDPELFGSIAKAAVGSGMGVQFHMFGDGPIIKKMTAYYSDVVEFHGWRSAKDIYVGIDILILTSPIENCPYSVIEAKKFGIPTIAYGDGGLPEIVEHMQDGYLVKKRVVSEYLLGINEVINSYNEFSGAAFCAGKRFSARDSSQKIWKFLSEKFQYLS
ncbi:RfaG Glycosyltransferase [Burkholderiaceae bacterium]